MNKYQVVFSDYRGDTVAVEFFAKEIWVAEEYARFQTDLLRERFGNYTTFRIGEAA